MREAGILGEDDRVELVEGDVVAMTPIGSAHAACVKRLTLLLFRAAGELALVSVQDPVRLDEASEPKPDLALLHPKPDFYASGHPGPEDVLLLIEVADASLAYDQEVKLPLYARAGIREVWLVDLPGRRVLVHREPGAGGYAAVTAVGPEGRLTVPVLGVDLPVGDVLGLCWGASCGGGG